MEMWSVVESGVLCASSIQQEINEVYVSYNYRNHSYFEVKPCRPLQKQSRRC